MILLGDRPASKVAGGRCRCEWRVRIFISRAHMSKAKEHVAVCEVQSRTRTKQQQQQRKTEAKNIYSPLSSYHNLFIGGDRCHVQALNVKEYKFICVFYLCVSSLKLK